MTVSYHPLAAWLARIIIKVLLRDSRPRPMNGMLKISIENSTTPIYRRIIDCLAKSLRERSHHVSIETPESHNSVNSYINSQISKECDYTLITNDCSLTSAYIENLGVFTFELLPCRLIFLHHDNCIARPGFSPEMLFKLYSAFKNTSERSHHFCIESSNCEELRQLGVANAHLIRHASEFNLQPLLQGMEFGTSFVGHVLGMPLQLDDMKTSHRIQRDYWSRVCNASHPIRTRSQQMDKHHQEWEERAQIIAQAGHHVSTMHNYSLLMRGEILKRASEKPIDIFGGDPAYLHGVKASRTIDSPNLIYHPPTKCAEEAAYVYSRSLINNNITPLQFDTCVINRVIDIGAAGGFPLTDWKEDLASITSVHKQISYESPEELQEKILYYSQPEHQKERLEICDTLYNEIHANFSYAHIVDYLLEKLGESPRPETLTRVDLGCGSHKATGYIGVDLAPSPSVDVVADLTRRFPFDTSTVDHLRAYDIIEHLPDRIHTMNEIWRISKPDALIDIRVPSTDGRGAFQDPTHVSFWNINSFLYYTRQYPAYLNLCQSYGFKGEYEIIKINEEATEDKVIHVNVILKVIKSIDNSTNSESASANHSAAPEPGSSNWNPESELRDINILVNLQQEDKPVNENEYTKLRQLMLTLINGKNSGTTCLLVGSKNHNAEEISNILTQLMLDLLVADQVPFSQDPPSLIPAPKTQTNLNQLRPYLVCELPLSEINMDDIQNITARRPEA